MTQTQEMLYREIASLPYEKVGKALSFVRYLEQEPEPELILDPAEEKELHTLLASGDTINAPDMLKKIEALGDD